MATDVSLQFQALKNQLKDVLKLYQGKTKQYVIQQSTYRREVLADTVFALKDITEKLFNMAENMHTNSDVEVKMDKLVLETLPGIVREAMKSLTPNQGVTTSVTRQEKEKHVVLVEPDTDQVFSKESWADVVKQINVKVDNIPVRKNGVNKNGKGYIILPDKESQEKAEEALREDFIVTTAVNKQNPKLLPKLKIFDLEGYSREEKSELKDAIIKKNTVIKQLVVNQQKTLDIVFIDPEKKYAVIKVSPEVRKVILKSGSVFIDMESHHVKDHHHLLQCFRCQQYGHKCNSEHCSMVGEATVCLYCANNHRSKDCPSKSNKNNHKCNNCLKSKNPAHRRGAHGHTTVSVDCPVRMKEFQALINRTENICSKNSH